jgi:hypothetical protein
MFRTNLLEIIRTNVLNQITFSRKRCRLRENAEKYGSALQVSGDNKTYAHFMLEATDAYSQYVPIIAFPLQQWLHMRASLLQNTHSACLVII